MALEEFEREELSARDKAYLRMRSMMDYGMGVLWMAMGFFMIFVKKISPDLAERFDSPWMIGFGVICILYAVFRIYRGYKKNYLRER